MKFSPCYESNEGNLVHITENVTTLPKLSDEPSEAVYLI